MKDKIVFIVGTRPEAIKLAPVISRFQGSVSCDAVVINTGQHRELARDFLKIFGLSSSADCRVMRPGQTLAQLTARLLKRLDLLFQQEKPRLTFVQGDTTSALCGALTSFYNQVPVAHVEAGLRTFDPLNPFPEETNRVLISQLADEHFVPTLRARQNLLAEGIPSDRITVSGNSVVDALYMILQAGHPVHHPALQKILHHPRHHMIVTVTAHRRENWEGGIRQIALALRALAHQFPNGHFVFSLHPNPAIQAEVHSILSETPGVALIDSLEYPDFIQLVSASKLVISDSGGVQEEAPSLGVPVLITRHRTERPEVVEAGWGTLVGTDQTTIVREATRILTKSATPRLPQTLFGDGQAAERIFNRIIHRFGSHDREALKDISPFS